MDDNDADRGKVFVFIDFMGKGNDVVDDVSAVGVAVGEGDRSAVVVVVPFLNNTDDNVLVLPVPSKLVVEASV